MDPLFDFKGQVALVTGGSRGLGRQMALALAARGAALVIASRKADACDAVVAEIEALGARAVAVPANVGQWAECERLAEEAWGAFGRLDCLVNNAGSGPLVASEEVSEALFDKVVGLNFKGPFRLSALIARRMADGAGGAILNISSIASIQPMARVVPYSAAKAALNAMTAGLAQEYAPKVRVNAIAAGPFLTDIAKAWPEEARASAPNALKRPGEPLEIVTAALMLLSPASSFATGAILRVDGGH
jgi:NAD(P)-dependent dehydrogenase (short-subunit alcohol dehydrogenase family)